MARGNAREEGEAQIWARSSQAKPNDGEGRRWRSETARGNADERPNSRIWSRSTADPQINGKRGMMERWDRERATESGRSKGNCGSSPTATDVASGVAGARQRPAGNGVVRHEGEGDRERPASR